MDFAIPADLQAYLVLTGSTPLESVTDYVYQPTRILSSVADLTAEITTGRPSDRLDSPVIREAARASASRPKHTIRQLPKPRLRPAMTK